MGNHSKDGYDLGLEDFDNNHGTEDRALVEFHRHYEDSCDHGLLKSAPKGSWLSEETLKSILQHSPRQIV